LQTAREVLYTAPIHLLDVCLLDENRTAMPLPATFEKALPVNLLAPSALLEKLSREQPERFALIRERVQSDGLEVIGGGYAERDDALLPVESKIWTLTRGLTVARELLGADLRVFSRRRFGTHPQLPQWLTHVGLSKAVHVAFDDAVLP